MSTLPPDKQYAYRHIVYWGLVEIRSISSLAYRRYWLSNFCILFSRDKHIEAKGRLADWLHNIAAFSRNDFHDFNEEMAWQDYKSCCGPYQSYLSHDYRIVWEQALADYRTK